MGNPFQDQLLKAGLVNKKQINKLKHEQRINQQQNRVENPPEDMIKARQEQAANEERNRELNRQHNEAVRQREKLAQVRQIIETNRLTRDDRGEPYYFTVGSKIKKLFISEEMAAQLSRGEMAIVKMDESFEVVTARVAQQIVSRDKDTVIVFHQAVKDAKL